MTPLQRQFALGNYAYAGVAPGRSPFYLPDSVRPTSGVGYARNLSLGQVPGTETTFLIGDGQRKIVPLVLSGTYLGRSEEDARLWGAALEESLPRWTQLQRSADVTRALLMGGSVSWGDASRPHIRPFTLTLNPAGPTWLDVHGTPVPF